MVSKKARKLTSQNKVEHMLAWNSSFGQWQCTLCCRWAATRGRMRKIPCRPVEGSMLVNTIAAQAKGSQGVVGRPGHRGSLAVLSKVWGLHTQELEKPPSAM